MTTRFEFATAGRIIFGNGALREAAPIAKSLGRHALVVTGRNTARAQPLVNALAAEGLATTLATVTGEPTTVAVSDITATARDAGCDLVIGFGGGSAIDAAKAIAALLANPGDLIDYLEIIGRAQPLPHAPLPCIAIPTTAGTGAEVTRNAVLASPDHKVKVSLRHPLMLPRVAIIDPELTLDLPPALTAATGLDALTQLIEPFVCTRANPMTDALCREGITRAARSLRAVFANGHDLNAREDMAVASLHGGLALANSGLGAVHGFAGPIGGMFPAPHGAVCAALLPGVIRANLRALRSRLPNSAAEARYTEIARILNDSFNATADDAASWTQQLIWDLQIPSLRTYGISASDIPSIVEKAARASSMKANPIELTAMELTTILEEALGTR